MSNFVITTSLGSITMTFLPSAAPRTVAHVQKLITTGLFSTGQSTFYRSDFVIQTGLYGTSIENPIPDLEVNETQLHEKIGNERGAMAIAHFDVPDNGNSEMFISLQNNIHLDEAYGGYCVFARVEDDKSFKVIDAVAAAVKGGTNIPVTGMNLKE